MDNNMLSLTRNIGKDLAMPLSLQIYVFYVEGGPALVQV